MSSMLWIMFFLCRLYVFFYFIFLLERVTFISRVMLHNSIQHHPCLPVPLSRRNSHACDKHPSKQCTLLRDPIPSAKKTPYPRPNNPDRDSRRKPNSSKPPLLRCTPEESYKTKCRKHTTPFQSHRCLSTSEI
jgi:hypothetical protein